MRGPWGEGRCKTVIHIVGEGSVTEGEPREVARSQERSIYTREEEGEITRERGLCMHERKKER